ncbi:MAG: flagellar biosynthetic protein FliO [Chitinispirillales bacterium]|nr:flagellar biosynthetic protein FliO [Chitinispirillales bacterium]
MKSFVRFFSAALVLLSISLTTAPPAYGQDDDVGAFDIDLVYEDAVRGDDSLLADGGPYAFTRQPENYALVIMRITGYLVVITAFIFALAWGVRKVGVAGVAKVSGGNNMDTIETLYFGQNRGAALIRVGDTVYLLGHTPDSIVLLEKIEGEKAIELIAASKGGTSIVNFKDAFNNFMGKMKKT